MDEALNLLRVSLPANIRIETILDPKLRVKGDSTRLHQVIMNITTNGAQAIGDKGGILKVTLKGVSLVQQQAEKFILHPGHYCCLEISDDGPGISDEIQARIFEPFFTTKKAGKGTGMGLAVVHGIIQSHGGVIIMSSKPGIGTSFSIYLPRTDENVVGSAVKSTIPRGNGENIIIIDDEIQVLDMGSSILKNSGYNVTSFHDPRTALAYLRQEKSIDLVITDLTMPEMSGVELAASIKSYHPHVPIMLWTGYKDDIASESLKKNMIDSIIQKPFGIQDLTHAVNDLISKQLDT